MKQKLKMVLLVLIGLSILSINIYAQHELESKSKKANKNDILGTWEMIYQVVRSGINTDSLFFANFQMLQFSEDDYVKNLTSTKEISYEEAKLYLETMPKKTTFSFVADGLLIIERSEQDFDNIVISIVTEDLAEPLRKESPLLKKGELILSYLDPNKKLYMQRYFKRINLE